MSEKSVCPCCESEFTSEDVSTYRERKRIDKEFKETCTDALAKISEKRKKIIYESLFLLILALASMLYLALSYEEFPMFIGFIFHYLLPVMFISGLIGVLTRGFWSGTRKRKRLFKAFKLSKGYS